jgi:hypothetical protein
MACTQSSQCTLDSHVVCRYCRCPADYKAGRAGLECRTEEELDEKVAEMEHSIQHDGLTLNVSGPTAVLWPRQLGSVQFVHGCWQHVSLARKHGATRVTGKEAWEATLHRAGWGHVIPTHQACTEDGCADRTFTVGGYTCM